ncbi:transcriptional regulator [Shewanella sp. Isolate8]|uniref:transcriptional regulator n=1 Tax=Shewanella sp. Isolate8 TaxID=2908529 RepID=UPI001EFC79A3|nr:transcriptional regulator [Shewanella sp. Isolate8]MCG9747178.1 transcriptional regulator [Shewanella sp. Isolate8]
MLEKPHHKTQRKDSQNGARKFSASEYRHKNATTTPEMRQFIQESDLPVSRLAKVLNISEATVRKWRRRDSINDTPNTPHHLNTTLTPMQEYVVVGLRYQLKMPLDRLLKVTQEFINPNVSRSGLARCLKRYGVSRIHNIERPEVPDHYFNQLPIAQGSDIVTYTLNPETLAHTLALPQADGDTVLQVASLTLPPQLADAEPSSVLLGIDPHSDWIYLDIYQDGNTQATKRYITHLLRQGPFHLRKLLVRNYHTFLQRFPGATMAQLTPGADIQTPEHQVASGDS